MNSISSSEAFEKLKNNAVMVDIRPDYELSLRVFDVKNVIYIPYGSYRDEFNVIPRDRLIIIADSVGNHSAEVARFLIEQGFPQVTTLAGGIVAWDRSGLPLKKDVDYEMIGGCACRLQPQKAWIEGSSVAPKLV